MKENNNQDYIRNVFAKEYKGKRVLISYIVFPFLRGEENYSHTNYLECYTAAKLFDELGYVVDVIQYNTIIEDLDYSNYNIIYGFGVAMEVSFYCDTHRSIKIINYVTGINQRVQNRNTANRLNQFYEKHKVYIPTSARLVNDFFSMQTFSPHAIFVLGGLSAINTYKDDGVVFPEIHDIHCFYYDVGTIDLNKKKFEKVKSCFLWFGSDGLIHKGLDLVIDYFLINTGLTLHICGANFERESDFYDVYKEQLEQASNIIIHGYVNIKSPKFKEVLMSVGAVVFPSCSEGSSPSLLNVMAASGVLPIVSNMVGIDFEEGSSILIEELNDFYMTKAIDQYMAITPCRLKEIANSSISHIRHKYSHIKYQNRLRELLSQHVE